MLLQHILFSTRF